MTTKKGCLGLILSIFGGSAQEPDAKELKQLPYQSRASLLTPAEISFYHVLTSAAGDKAIVCPKVGMKDVLFIPGRHDRDYFRFFAYISQKHIDFVLCDPKSMRPLLAIELDDSSHRRDDRAERDTFVEKALRVAQLPLLRFAAANTYNTRDVATAVEAHLASATSIQDYPLDINADSQQVPLCPRHGLPMILRTAAKGPNAGQQFYGCPQYPDCREIVRLE